MNGCNGKMGQTITEICKADADIEIMPTLTIQVEDKSVMVGLKKVLESMKGVAYYESWRHLL